MPATVSITEVGPGEYEVQVVETLAATGTEVPLVDDTTGQVLPVRGTVRRQICLLTGGTGTTVQPQLTRVAGGTTVDIVVRVAVADAAAEIDQAGTATYNDERSVDPGTLYHRSQVDAAADNSIETTYHIKAGW